MTVKELISELSTMDPEKKIEIELIDDCGYPYTAEFVNVYESDGSVCITGWDEENFNDDDDDTETETETETNYDPEEYKNPKEWARKYLETDYAKKWLEKLNYTTRELEDGTTYHFICVLPEHRPLDEGRITQLCKAVYLTKHDDSFGLSLSDDGVTGWSMLYSQPYGHVNGHETYRCHAIGIDGYSPEDWDEDVAKIRVKNGTVTPYDFISYLWNGRKFYESEKEV